MSTESKSKIINITEHLINEKINENPEHWSFIRELFGDTKKFVEIVAFVIVGIWLWKRFKGVILVGLGLGILWLVVR